MAGNWEGFTDDDIKFYLGKASNTENPSADAPKHKVASLKAKQRTNAREKRLPVSASAVTTSNTLPEAALLLKPTENTEEKSSNKEQVTTNTHLEPEILITTSPLRSALEEKIEDNKGSTLVPSITLETFQARQKLLEEQNRQRKQLLTKVLSDRKKQTTDEARRLQKIQEELHKLDILLSNDVGILRDEIEVAAREFGEAQSRYSRAEKEFLEAKQILFIKLERKELLTKHLCTIIEQNEVRKAQKLSELMNQLSVDQSSVTSMQATTVPNAETKQTPENPPQPSGETPDAAVS